MHAVQKTSDKAESEAVNAKSGSRLLSIKDRYFMSSHKSMLVRTPFEDLSMVIFNGAKLFFKSTSHWLSFNSYPLSRKQEVLCGASAEDSSLDDDSC